MSIEDKQLQVLERLLHVVERIERAVCPPPPLTPTSITFSQENPMLAPVAGNTLVYTGTLAPAGATFPAGTTFSLQPSDPTVTPTVDATGLIVTIALPSTFVDNPAAPFNVVYTASGITPNPASAPSSITATITPSAPTLTPAGISFQQTT
jgi:hypothetical protein